MKKIFAIGATVAAFFATIAAATTAVIHFRKNI